MRSGCGSGRDQGHPGKFGLIEGLEPRRLLSSGDPSSIVMLPDIQYYSQSYPSISLAQTQWVAQQAEPMNIAFAAQMGDLVQNSGDGVTTNVGEWANADAAMGNLHSVLPYAACPGNHDYVIKSDHASAAGYLQWFGPGRYTEMAWYGASPDGQNHYQLFSAGGRDFLHLSLEWEAPDSALAWAQGVINAFPNRPTIVSTHAYMGTSGRLQTATVDYNSGEDIFNELVKPNPQVFMVLCGHVAGEYHQVSTNADGQQVVEMLADYQSLADGGSGYLRVITLDPALDRIDVKTYSPWLNQYQIDSNSQFSIAMDFDERFDFRPTVETSFQQDADGYAGAADTELSQADAATSYAGETSLNVDADEPQGTGNVAQALLRFDDLFGTLPGQIPPGATIASATLQLSFSNGGNPLALHRMLTPWNDTDTWNTFGGIQPGAEAESAAELTTGTVPTGTVSLDVTASLRAWNAEPTANFGWAILPTGSDGSDFASSEATVAARPRLIVRYRPADGVNDAPFARDDAYTMAEDASLAGNVMANDTDPDGDALSCTLITGPAQGTFTFAANGAFTYAPAADWSGQATFTYTVSDGLLTSNTATATITVSPVNDAPVVSGTAVSTPEDQAVLVDLWPLAGDVDDPVSSLGFSVGAATNGTVTLIDGHNARFTPAANYSGAASFAFSASDGSAASNTATITISVTAVNDAPEAVNDTATTTEGTAINGASVLANDSDVESSALTSTLVSGPGNGTVVLSADGTFTYTPAAGFVGQDSFVYAASDGELGTAATVTITVNSAARQYFAAADAPVYGAVTGTYTDTVAAGGTAQSIKEELYAANKKTRLEHRWRFDGIAAANAVEFQLTGWRSSGVDQFRFEYSQDAVTWTPAMTLVSTTATSATAALPASLSGTVWVRVVDTDTASGERSQETVYVDRLCIQTFSGAVPPAVSISAPDPAAAEAGADTGTFRVTRTGDTTEAMEVFYTAGGTAAPGDDYPGLPGSVVIEAGASYADFSVTPIDDTLAEPDETVTVSLALDSGYSVEGGPATVTIADNDQPAPAAPAAPTDLAVVSTTRGKVKLSWTDNSLNETGFRVYISTDGITWKPYASVAAKDGSGTLVLYTTPALKNSAWFQVTAFNADGESPASEPVHAILN